MPERNYRAPDFGVRDTRQVTGSQIAQSDNRVNTPISSGDTQWQDKLLTQLSQQGGQLLNKMADVEYSNLYLEGQAKVGLIESEAEIQGNPLTRDWEVAGYRDTVGKLALADAEAKFGVDLKELRGEPPEKFHAYLSERRNKLMPGIASMSREARASVAGQMLLQDRAATQQYTKERAKFIIDTKQQAISTQAGTAMGALQQAQIQENPEGLSSGFVEQLRSTAGMLEGSVWRDSSLPTDVKRNLTFEALSHALSKDVVSLYDYITQNPIADATGGTSTLFARLDGEQQIKLSNQYREAMARTSDVRGFTRLAQVADVESQIGNNVYTGTYGELTGMLLPMVRNKTIQGERAATLVKKFLDMQYTSERSGSIGDAWARGDDNALNGYKANDAEGMRAYEDVLNRNNVPNDKRVGLWMAAGMNGRDGGFTKVGEALGVSLRQMRRPDGTVLPQHVENVRAINQYLAGIEGPGQNNARTRVLAGLGEADRMLAERVFAGVNDTKYTYDDAMARALDLETKEAALTPGKSAAIGQASSAKVQGEIDAIGSRGWATTFLSGVRSLFGGAGGRAASASNVIQPETRAFEDFMGDSPTTTFYVEQSRAEVTAEAKNVLLARPYASPQEAINVAKANVAARAIEVPDQGVIFMPKNSDLLQTYGVGPGNQAVIGKAIGEVLKTRVGMQGVKEDSRWALMFSNGRLFAQEYVKGVAQGNGDFIQPEAIRTKITEMTNAEQKRAEERHGAGKTVKIDGVTLSYNGTNTSGIPADWMFELRNNLVTNEGVRATPYTDLSGKLDKAGKPIMTVGVGVSSHNPNYPKVGPDGKVSDAAIQQSFATATDAVASVGRIEANRAAVNNKAGFALMAELAYQSGEGFMTQKNSVGDEYRELRNALRAKNATAATEAFKKTAAWRYSADSKDATKLTPRRKHYLNLINTSLKGY